MYNIQKDYNEEELRSTLSKLKFEKRIIDDRVDIVTRFDGRILNISNLSKKYGVFNFGHFLQELLTPLQKYFIIETYDLIISGAVQELRLYSAPITHNNEPSRRIVSIISSSNGSISLQMNVGIAKGTTPRRYHYFFVGDDERIHITTKHFKNSVKENMKKFVDALPYLGVLFDNQEKLLESITSTRISIKELGKRMVYDKNGKIKPSLMSKFEKMYFFIRRELSRMGELPDTMKFMYPKQFLESEYDMEYNSYDLLSLHIRSFTQKHSSELAKEGKRIYDIIKEIKTTYVPLSHLITLGYSHTDRKAINLETLKTCALSYNQSEHIFIINKNDLTDIGLQDNKHVIKIKILENNHTKEFKFNRAYTDMITKKKISKYVSDKFTLHIIN